MTAAVETVAEVAPDILLLTSFDWDFDNEALSEFARLTDYPNYFALQPNAGLPSGLDLDADGRLGTPRDAQGFGRFRGDGGLALLSNREIYVDGTRDFSTFLWADLPDALVHGAERGVVLPENARGIQRLSSTSHWMVPVQLGDDQYLNVLTFGASPPVFDGPEDRNGRRNHDEIRFWSLFLEGALKVAPPEGFIAVLGNANLDPNDGDGRRTAIHQLLSQPLLQDPEPRSETARIASERERGANDRQKGDPALDTANFRDDPGPGNLRVSYVLPDARAKVGAAGVAWSDHHRHGLVWVDVELQVQ